MLLQLQTSLQISGHPKPTRPDVFSWHSIAAWLLCCALALQSPLAEHAGATACCRVRTT